MGRLDNKVALITGGARGQGEAESRLFVAEGARVVITDVLDAEGENLARELGEMATYARLDVTDEDNWDRVISDLGPGGLDILVNNAGIALMASLLDATLDHYRKVIEVNQVGTWLGMRAAGRAMRDSGGGSIVNISSIDGFHGMPAMTAYASSKFAVRGMTKAAALDLGSHGIRVNSVHPGLIDTPMLVTGGQEVRESLGKLAETFPVGRLGTAKDVAQVVLFLASDESGYCTGTEFVVDGGLIAGVTFDT
ncbi:MAG: glucose 1-dehydrogenase [Ilumatobacteraceae bacterium]|nr:glucose 1-dehydrogenase [Ilumatobacteraceae bacterium]